MDSDIDEITNEELPDKHVDKLIDKVLRLNKTQKIKKPSRTEPTLTISEFDLVKTANNNKANIQLNQLTRPLNRQRNHKKITKVLKNVKKTKVLPKPLEKPQAERIRRGISYEKTRLELDRWEPIIQSNRVSNDLKFPLNTVGKLCNNEREQIVNRFRIKSDLQKELNKIETYNIGINIQDDIDESALTMEEILQHRKEVAKLRAYQSYREAKARRQKRIKSKKYHRIQKKERIKQQLKEFEQLQKIDPEAALKKLDEIERARAEERFSLRHKSTGQWARNQKIRAKYDKESRQVLAQQLSLSKELTQKTKTDDNESDIDELEKHMEINPINDDNPWIVNGIEPDKEVVDFVSGYRKFWNQQNQQLQQDNIDTNNDKEDGIIVENTNDNDNNNNNNINAVIDGEEVEKIPENISEINDNVAIEAEEVEKIAENTKEINDSVAIEVANVEKIDKLEDSVAEKSAVVIKKVVKKKKKRKEVDGKSKKKKKEVEGIDEMFDKLENKLEKRMLKNYAKLMKSTKTIKKTINNETTKKIKVDLSMPLQKKRPIIDEEMNEDTNITPQANQNDEINQLKTLLKKDEPPQQQQEVDPNKFINTKITNLPNELPDILIEENEEFSNQQQQQQQQQHDLMLEAFEDSELVTDFNKEKTEEIDKDKPKDIDLTLPGWGEWGGTNIKINPRKKRRFIIKAPPKIQRKDDNKGNLIINECAQKKIKQHQVNEIPFPFKTVKDFEASIRAPISRTFVPETAFKRLIKPDVVTKMGAVIEPMSKDVLLKKK